MGNIVTFARDGLATLGDSLTSLVANINTKRDKAASTFYAQPLLSDEEILNAYRGAWLPRKIIDIPAFDSVRAWRDWQAKGGQIELIEAEEKRLNIKGKLLQARIRARLWGGAALMIGTGEADLAKPLNVEKVGKGGLKYLTVLTRRQLTAGEIERDPASEWYGRPQAFRLKSALRGQVDIHPSRLVMFSGNEQPDDDLSLGAYQGWGDSVLVSVMDAIKQADGTAANIASLVFEAKVNVIRIPEFMQSLGDPVYRQKLLERYTLAATSKGINGDLLLDKDEEFEQKTASFATLPEVLMSFLQIVSGASDIPATRLLGQSPAGMNATGESDLRNYYDRLQAMQEVEMTPAMSVLDECLIRSATGTRDKDVHFTWAPLWGMSEKEKADVFKTKADAGRALAGTNTSPALLPIDALSDALVNTFIEDGSLPGLEAAMEEYGRLSEQEDEGDDIEASTIPEKVEEKPQTANDAAPRTLYVRRDVLNAKQIIAWAKKQGFKTTLPADDMHVTITFSRQPVDWMEMGSTWEDEVKVPRGGARLMEKFGEARVLLFNSNMLRWRHEEMVEKGATWDHPEYNPHITISYDPDAPDLANVEPYQGEIVLGPEIFEELNENWKAGVKEQ